MDKKKFDFSILLPGIYGVLIIIFLKVVTYQIQHIDYSYAIIDNFGTSKRVEIEDYFFGSSFVQLTTKSGEKIAVNYRNIIFYKE